MMQKTRSRGAAATGAETETRQHVALITGAGSGLGRQLALTLAADGFQIGALDRIQEPLSSLAAEMTGKKMAWAVADVTDRNALRKGVTDLEEQLGPVDLLIANAGIGIENSALAFQAADFEAQIRVNLIGVANTIEMVLPGMLERGRGQIVGISSVASYRGLPRMAGYCASKAGLNALLEALRVEVKPRGIAVTIICPSWIRTPLTEKLDLPPHEVMGVEKAARLIANAIYRRRDFYAFPARAVRRVLLLRWLPSGLSDRLVRLTLKDMELNKSPEKTSP